MVDALLRARGGGVAVLDDAEVDDDLVRDVTEVSDESVRPPLRAAVRPSPGVARLGGGGFVTTTFVTVVRPPKADLVVLRSAVALMALGHARSRFSWIYRHGAPPGACEAHVDGPFSGSSPDTGPAVGRMPVPPLILGGRAARPLWTG